MVPGRTRPFYGHLILFLAHYFSAGLLLLCFIAFMRNVHRHSGVSWGLKDLWISTFLVPHIKRQHCWSRCGSLYKLLIWVIKLAEVECRSRLLLLPLFELCDYVCNSFLCSNPQFSQLWNWDKNHESIEFLKTECKHVGKNRIGSNDQQTITISTISR